MDAYKFETTVQKDGIIKIPEIRNLINQRVEVFIVEKKNHQNNTIPAEFSFEEFSRKWRGFLKGAKIEKYKNDHIKYLQEKYQ
ncbi:hypothetical protein H8E88_16530 [candidate division KSB1 bacterium]|nr:hypothetical protein [candidate division KSB1 bacterium]MBL7094061.1 hypothetical protein [candidate division KSB1 bacterium]